MKPKKLLFSALMLFALINTASAQIEQEIKSFVDSTEILVNNGRRMMLQSVQTGDFERVAEIFEFLNERTQIDNCVAFTLNEMLDIALLTNNWNEFFARVANPFSTYFYTYRRTSVQSLCLWNQRDNLGTTLRTKVRDSASQIFERVLMTDLTLEQKDLLELYFYSMENGNTESYSRKLRIFKRKYPQSPYLEFVKIHLPSGWFRGGMGWSAGATQVFPTGNLSNYFEPATLITMSLDWHFNNFLIGLHINAGDMRLNTPLLSTETGYDYDFRVNNRFSYFDGGVLFGYALFRNSWIEFTPFVNIGGTTLKSNLYSEEDNDLEFTIIDSFTTGPGLRTEFILYRGDIDLISNINLRLDLGYNIPVKYSFSPAKGNIPYARIALVWRFGAF